MVGRFGLLGLTALSAFLVAFVAPPVAGSQTLNVGALTATDDLSLAMVQVSGEGGAEAVGPHGRLTIKDHILLVPLAFRDEPVIQSLTVHITTRTVDGDVTLKFYSQSYYDSIGASFPGALLLATTLPREPVATLGPGMEDEVLPTDRANSTNGRWATARAEGVAPLLGDSVPDSVLSLYRRLDELNDPAVGQLCPDGSGIDTLYMLSSGACYVWCAGNAKILRGFLKSAGIPARLVALDPETSILSDGVQVQSSEAHGTVEWWNGQKWVWIGPTSRALQATIRGEPLSARELIIALAAPATRSSVQFTRLDSQSGSWRTLTYDSEDAGFKDSLGTDFSIDKTLVGVGRASEVLPTPLIPLTLVAGSSLAVSLLAFLHRRRRRPLRTISPRS